MSSTQTFPARLSHISSDRNWLMTIQNPYVQFQLGNLVYVENFTTSPPKWIPGKVVKVTGPLSYQVELESGTVVRRHVDSVRSRSAVSPAVGTTTELSGNSQLSNSSQVDPLTLPELLPGAAPPPPPPVPGPDPPAPPNPPLPTHVGHFEIVQTIRTTVSSDLGSRTYKGDMW